MQNLNQIIAENEKFEIITVFNQNCLFTPYRINRDNIPDGLHLYDVRHDDDSGFDPVHIAPSVFVNHYGTLITNKPFDFKGETFGYIPSEGDNDGHDPKDEWVFTDEMKSITEFLLENVETN